MSKKWDECMMNLSSGKASPHTEQTVRQQFAGICTAIVRFCWLRLGLEPGDKFVSLVGSMLEGAAFHRKVPCRIILGRIEMHEHNRVGRAERLKAYAERGSKGHLPGSPFIKGCQFNFLKTFDVE